MCCPWRASSAQDKFCTAVLKGTPASLHLWVMSHALKSCKQIVNSHTRENLQQAFKIKWKKQQCCQIPISSYLLQAAWLLLKRVYPREAALLAHFRTRVDSDDLPIYTEQNNLLGIALLIFKDHWVQPPNHFRANQKWTHFNKDIFQMPLEHWQAQDINHLVRKPVPVSDNHHSKDTFPNVPSKPPLVLLCAISLCPITSYQGEELSASSSASPAQEVEERCCTKI